MISKLSVLIVALLINDIHGIIHYLNESEYNRMPPIYKLDDYEVCLQQPSAIYCSVHFNLVSDIESELLNMIVEYSKETRTHYNHSQLIYGVCITQSCQTYVTDRNMISKTFLEACLNDTFMNDYQLKTEVINFDCHGPTDPKEVFDTADKAVATFVLTIIMLNVVGSIYDLRNIPKIKENVLVCFSMQRNWTRLTSYTTNPDPRIEHLKVLNGIRCIILIVVLIVHCSWPFVRAAQNSYDLERMFYDFGNIFIRNGSLIVQSNILISGFLLTYNIELYSEKNTIHWYIIPKAFLMRYFRFTPVYAVIVAVSATWLKFLGPGPLWEVIGNQLSKHCRSDWWRNLLYINNYKYNSQCILPTWYLGMDMQLFCLGIILCVSTQRRTTWRKPVLSCVLFLGVVIIAIHTYVRDLDPIFIVTPGSTRTLYDSDRTFNETYKMGHTNIPSFIIGMILGYSVYKWQKTGIDVSKHKKLRYMYWALFPVTLAVMFSAEVFFRDAPRYSLAVRVAYAAVAKPFFATLMAVIIAGTIFKKQNMYRKALEWEKWTIPSRLSGLSYVGLKHSLLVLSYSNLLLLLLGVISISFISAVPLWLLVEAPFTEVSKYYFKRSHQTKMTKNVKKC